MKRACVACMEGRERGRTDVSLRTAVLMAAGAVGIFYGGMYARATPGGEVRKGLSFAGTLTGVSGRQRLTFTFTNKTGVTCAVPSKDTHENGSFVAELAIDSCPANLFDGGDVTYTVKVGEDTLPGEFNVNPVPYAKYAEQAGTPECPVGYERSQATAGIIACRRGRDEVVRVGSGATAFWIDRYEASVWSTPDTSGTRYTDSYPAAFPPNGQWSNTALQGTPQPFYALSVEGQLPSTRITWFQANEACAASGKRLPTGVEWLRAAQGTPSIGGSGDDGFCITNRPSIQVTQDGSKCRSRWGAMAMHGNVEEWTADWFAGVGGALPGNDKLPWPDPSYGGDKTYNVASKSDFEGSPAAGVRGGAANEGDAAGIFNLNLLRSPATAGGVGFRCIIPR